MDRIDFEVLKDTLAWVSPSLLVELYIDKESFTGLVRVILLCLRKLHTLEGGE